MQGRLDHAALNTTWTSAGTILNESGPLVGKASHDHAAIWSVGPCRAHVGGGPRFRPKERGETRDAAWSRADAAHAQGRGELGPGGHRLPALERVEHAWLGFGLGSGRGWDR